MSPSPWDENQRQPISHLSPEGGEAVLSRLSPAAAELLTERLGEGANSHYLICILWSDLLKMCVA